MFDAGFALLGYCPGTGAAALGQGNFDAWVGIVGMLGGSHLFAELSHPLARVSTWGNRGGVMINDVVGVPLRIYLPIFVPLLVAALCLLEQWAG